MFMERQGVNLAPIVKELEKRIEVLENVVKALQLDKPRMGRPPKDKNGTERLEINPPS
mgnify:CR=1 FL=1|jgi:hypothetical protein